MLEPASTAFTAGDMRYTSEKEMIFSVASPWIQCARLEPGWAYAMSSDPRHGQVVFRLRTRTG